MARTFLVLACLVLAIGCSKGGNKIRIEKSLKSDQRVTSDSEKELKRILGDSTECLPLESIMKHFATRTNEMVTVYTSDIELDFGTAAGQAPNPADEVLRARMLKRLSGHVIFKSVLGSELTSVPVVGDLLNVKGQNGCSDVTFEPSWKFSISLPPAKTFGKRQSSAGVSPLTLKMFEENHQRLYREDNGNLMIAVETKVLPNTPWLCGARPGLVLRERFVIAHGTIQDPVRVRRKFMGLLADNLKPIPKALQTQLTPAKSASLTRVENIDFMPISVSLYGYLQTKLQSETFAEPACPK